MTKEFQDPNLDDFQDVLSHICLRPAMWVGVTDVYMIWTLLRGYSMGVNNMNNRFSLIGGWPLWDNFDTWLRLKFPIWDPRWGVDRVLLHSFDHDHKAAIAALPAFFKEYLEESKRTGFKDRWDELSEKLVNAPTCDRCRSRWEVVNLKEEVP